MVVGLDYRDAALSVHDLLQELKTHPRDPRDPRRRRAGRVGREDDPRGRLRRAAARVPRAGAAAVRRRRRARQRAGAEGDPLRDRVGAARGGGGVGRRSAAARSRRYDDALRSSFVWSDLRRVRNMRPSFAGGLWRGVAWSGAATVSRGPLPAAATGATERDDAHELLRDRPRGRVPGARRQAHVRQALVGVPRRATGRATTSRATSACRRRCRASWRELWAQMCPAQVYEVGPGEGDLVEVQVRRRTASSAARSPPRAAASPRPRAAPGPSTR